MKRSSGSSGRRSYCACGAKLRNSGSHSILSAAKIIVAIAAITALHLFFSVIPAAADISGLNIGSGGDGVGLSMAQRSDGGAAISYFNKTSKALRYSEFVAGSWSTTDVDTSLTTLATTTVDGAVSYSSPTALVFLAGIPHIIYYDAAGQKLQHAYRSGSSWFKDTILSGLISGGAPSAAACGTTLCISFYDGSAKDLRFVKGNSGSWAFSTLDTAGDVGSMSSITIKPDGLPAIIYYDATNQLPKVAIQAVGGAWSSTALTYLDHPLGLFPDIVAASDGTLYASFSHYRTSSATFDTGVYLAHSDGSGNWDLSQISDDYSGGPTKIKLDSLGQPTVAYRYLRKSADSGDAAGVYVSTLQANGTWTTDIAYGEFGFSGAIYSYNYLGLSFSPTATIRVVYAFDQAPYLTNPALTGMRFHGSPGAGSGSTTTVPTTSTTISTSTTSIPTTTTSVPTTTTSIPTTTTSFPTTTTTRASTTTTSVATTTTRSTTSTSIAPTTTTRSTTSTSIAPTTTSRPTTTTRPSTTTTSVLPTTSTTVAPTTTVPTTTSVPPTTVPTTTTTVPTTTTVSTTTTSSTTTISTTSTTTTSTSTTTTSIMAMVPAARINSGGTAYVDSAGFVWNKDGYFVGGSKSSKNLPVAGTADYKLYQSEHNGRAFRYTVPLANGIYQVKLHFNEWNYKLAGQRIFNVSIENSPALTNFDILREVPRFTALVKTFYVAVTDGALNIGFIGLKNSAKISAIDVQAMPADGLLINSGGAAALDQANQLWIADTGFYGGGTLTTAGAVKAAGAGGTSMSLRYGPYFGYRLPVPNGTYDVVFHFVEPFYDIGGQRLFSCYLEGRNEIPGLDIFGMAGKNSELALEATTTVNDGILTIDFIPDFPGHTPVVSAIEIHRSDHWGTR